MSLNWNYRSVGPAGQAMIEAAWLDNGEGGHRNPALDSVVWATLAIGIGQWTAANMAEVKRRMAIYQHINGPAITFGDGRAYYVTPDELDKLEGFSTNVSKETNAAFAKKVMAWVEGAAATSMRTGCKQYFGEGGADFEPCGAFQALANQAKRMKDEADARMRENGYKLDDAGAGQAGQSTGAEAMS